MFSYWWRTRMSIHLLIHSTNSYWEPTIIFFLFCLFRATPAAYGGSKARGRIRGAVAFAIATAKPDPSCVCNLHHGLQQRQVFNPLSKARNWTCVLMDIRFVSVEPWRELYFFLIIVFFKVLWHTHLNSESLKSVNEILCLLLTIPAVLITSLLPLQTSKVLASKWAECYKNKTKRAERMSTVWWKKNPKCPYRCSWQIRIKCLPEFPGGLVVKDQALLLLWLSLDPWPGNFHML